MTTSEYPEAVGMDAMEKLRWRNRAARDYMRGQLTLEEYALLATRYRVDFEAAIAVLARQRSTQSSEE